MRGRLLFVLREILVLSSSLSLRGGGVTDLVEI